MCYFVQYVIIIYSFLLKPYNIYAKVIDSIFYALMCSYFCAVE